MGEPRGEPQGIIVFGANGGGKTTLGGELARLLGFRHMDQEDYHFEKSGIPYTVERPREAYLALMLADIEKHRGFVLSAVTGDFGDVIPQFYRLAVLISAPKALRMERIKQRAINRYGARVRKGGDMYEGQMAFMNFAASRDLSKIERWAGTLACPLLHVDGTKDWRANAAAIAEQFTQLATSD